MIPVIWSFVSRHSEHTWKWPWQSSRIKCPEHFFVYAHAVTYDGAGVNGSKKFAVFLEKDRKKILPFTATPSYSADM